MLVVRNALRPFFNARKDIKRASQFQLVRQSVPLDQLEQLFRQTEGNRAYRFAGLGNTFPRQPDSVPDSRLRELSPLGLGRELSLQIGRINHHAIPLGSALVALADVNDAIRAGEWAEADKLAGQLRDAHGLSIAGMRKELLIAFQTHGLPGLSRRYTTMADSAERRAWAVLAHIAYDLMDPAFSPERATRAWLAVLQHRQLNSGYYKSIAAAELLGCWASKKELAEATLRYGGASLIDLCLSIWKAIATRPDWPEVAGAYERLDEGLADVLSKRFDTRTVVVPARYLVDEAEPTDEDVFRATFFFQEDAPIARWRAAFVPVLYPHLSGDAPETFVTELSPKATETDDEDEEQDDASDADVDPIRAFVDPIIDGDVKVRSINFMRSALVAKYLRSYGPDGGATPNQLIRLISNSLNIHEYLDREAILRLIGIDDVSKSKLLTFVLRDLLFRAYRTQDNELDRRAAFMDMFPVGGRELIVPFLDELATWSRATARHLARLCTRTFLERLYLLVSSVQEVVETRIAICDWLLANSGRELETIKEERDALERELANLDARSDLDSTRVHVDEDSLREWYGETQRAIEHRYKQTVLTEGVNSSHGVFLDFYNKTRERPKVGTDEEDLLADTQIGSEFILLTIFENTLRAFVTDKTFGLDSYLSRRIRHGTLRGFLTTPLSRVRRKLKDEIEAEVRPVERAELVVVADKMDAWLQLLAERLDTLRREHIQIRSERHSEGLIEASWRTPTNVRHLDAMLERTRTRVIDSRGGYDIFDDLYLLCWDVLERDLAHLRVYLNREFFREMASELSSLFNELTYEQRGPGHIYWNELHAILNGRIQEVCGWFIRPVFRRNSYDLRTLAESTISIVRELDDTYLFEDEVEISGIGINRGTFDVLGDILFVLIGNAAKHGKAGGLVRVKAELMVGPDPSISLTVTSEVQDPAALTDAETSMRRAADPLDRDSIHSAGTIEGFSGIRKIIGLLGRVRAAEDLHIEFDKEALCVRCRVVVPPTISFARERT